MDLGVYSVTNDMAVSIATINNDFYQRITNFAMNLAKEGKYLTLNFRNLPINYGGREFVDNGSIVDLGLVNPFYQMEGVNNIYDELAYVRFCMGGFDQPINWMETKYSLALDYLLRTSLCFVEIFNPNSTYAVDKFMATRSPYIACLLNGDDMLNKYNQYEEYLYMNVPAYQMAQFKLLKLSPNKNSNTFRVTMPRNSINMGQYVKVTPICLMKGFMEGIQELMDNNIVNFHYIKDNLTVRQMATSTSTDIIYRYYNHEHYLKALMNRTFQLNRGYMRVPELGLSMYDETGVRALNLTRIIKIEVLQDIDASFIAVDFDRIPTEFRMGVESISDIDTLRLVYAEVIGQRPNDGLDFFTLRNVILNHASTQFSVGTTMAKKEYHNYMVQREHIFKTYNKGVKIEEQSTMPIDNGFNFNMGLDD